MSFNGKRWGSSVVLPLISLVGRELESRTGPFQERSKKVLIVMFAGDVEKDLFDDRKLCEGVLKVARVRNRGVLLKIINGGVGILSAIWWGSIIFVIL